VLACGQALAARPFEQLVPEGALVYVSATNAQQLIQKVRSSPSYKLLSEPAMQPFVEKMLQGLAAPRAKLVEALGKDVMELRSILGGQVSLAVLPPEQGKEPGVLLLADVTGDPALARETLNKLLDYVRREQGAELAVTEETFHDRAIYRLAPVPAKEGEAKPAPLKPPGDEWGDEGWGDEAVPGGPGARGRQVRTPAFVMLDDEVLAVCGGPDRTPLEKHIVLRQGGDVATLGGSGRYRRLLPHLREDRDVTAYVDVRGLGELAGVDLFGAGTQGTAGAGEVGAFGFGLSMVADGVAGQGLLVAPAPRQGFMRPFTPERGGVLPPGFVDAAPGAYAAAHFNPAALWDEIMAVLQREKPDAYMQFQQQLKQMPFNLENDVVRAFGTRWYFYMPAGPAAAQGTPPPRVVVAAELANQPAFAAAWPQLLALLPPFFQQQTITFGGVTTSQFSTAAGWDPEPKPLFCVSILADKFLFTSDLATAKTIINNDKRERSPLLDDPGFQQLLSRTIDNPDGLVYVDGRVVSVWMSRMMEEQRRQIEEMRKQVGNEAFPAPEVPEPPPLEVMLKYEGPSLCAVRWVDEGLLIKSWKPNPAPQP
jgi:hypothetical protein